MLEPPEADSLLRGDGPDLDALSRRSEEPLVVPKLERFFLRHPAALPGLRTLLGALALRRAPTLVSCGSWTWAWLRAGLRIDSLFPDPLALAPLDVGALATWLGQAPAGKLACSQRDGGWVLWPGEGEPEGERSDFLRHLAAEARGHPVVALALWASTLRRPPAHAERAGSATTLHVPAWSRLELPGLGRRASGEEVALLHALLLHGALPVETLASVLPFGRAALARLLSDLARAGLVETDRESWRTSAAGQPAVRREMLAAALPADDL
jgi:hypothetical protein